jgi:hypothetical protein
MDWLTEMCKAIRSKPYFEAWQREELTFKELMDFCEPKVTIHISWFANKCEENAKLL